MSLKVFILACLLAVACGAHLGIQSRRGRLSNLGGRVIGGRNAKIGEFPYQIAVEVKSTGFWGLQCGGSILNKNWILTAAHCVTNLSIWKMRVKAGKNDIDETESFEQIAKVEDTFYHENYAPGADVSAYDIALIKLKSSLEFNEYVQPINLPEAGVDAKGVATLSGWGSIASSYYPDYPSILQTVDLPIISLKACNETIFAITGESPLHETNVCAGPLSGGFASCSGDSGGPLVVANGDGEKEIVGIVSWGFVPCGSKNSPSVFVKVSSFIDWIADTIRRNS